MHSKLRRLGLPSPYATPPMDRLATIDRIASGTDIQKMAPMPRRTRTEILAALRGYLAELPAFNSYGLLDLNGMEKIVT